MITDKIFTVSIDVFHGLKYFQQALENIRNQTYPNLEIIISNNGASNDIQEYIASQSKIDPRIRVINYENNIFDFNDPELRSFILCNDALEIAKGDYFFYQSYDDLLALDYVEKMVKLFYEDSNCISAAGIAISIFADNSIGEEELINRDSNLRPRFMPGHELVLDFINGGHCFSTPGTIFSFKTDFLKQMGGFHRSIELSQLYGVVPFGSSGFDESAIFYWRRGDHQLNHILAHQGYCGIKEFYDLLKDWDIYSRWLEFGSENAKNVIKYGKKSACLMAAETFCNNFFALRFRGVFATLKHVIFKRFFWMQLPSVFWAERRFHLYTLYQSLIGRKIISWAENKTLKNESKIIKNKE
jgi:hypothetical protein